MGKASNLKNGYRLLKIGMSKLEVLSLFGQPDSQKCYEEKEILGWWNREFKGLLRGGAFERRITVELKDDKVIGFDGENVDMSTL